MTDNELLVAIAGIMDQKINGLKNEVGEEIKAVSYTHLISTYCIYRRLYLNLWRNKCDAGGKYEI